MAVVYIRLCIVVDLCSYKCSCLMIYLIYKHSNIVYSEDTFQYKHVIFRIAFDLIDPYLYEKGYYMGRPQCFPCIQPPSAT